MSSPASAVAVHISTDPVAVVQVSTPTLFVGGGDHRAWVDDLGDPGGGRSAARSLHGHSDDVVAAGAVGVSACHRETGSHRGERAVGAIRQGDGSDRSGGSGGGDRKS